MDINALRVFNALYRLGITETEFKEISKEQSHTERTGLCVNLIKKGNIIGVSHDERHQIIINKISGTIKVQPKSRVLFKTLIPFMELPQEVYTLHQIAQYRALDTEIRYEVRNMDELKDRICDRFVDGYPKELGGMYEDVYAGFESREKNKRLKPKLVERQLKALFWLFGEDFTAFKPCVARKNIARIIKVFQRNNRRLAIIQINEEWNKKRGGLLGGRWTDLIQRTSFKITTFTPGDERFNFVSPNREIFLMYECDNHGKANIWLADDMFEKVSAEELKILSKRYDENQEDRWIYLTADEYNKQRTGIRLELMNAKRAEQEESARDRLSKAMQEQFKNGKVVRQGIEMTKNSIIYEGVRIENNKIGEYIQQQQIHLLERPSFNEIFEGFVDYLLEYEQIGFDRNYDSKMKSSIEGKHILRANRIKIILEKRNKLFYVNDHRIKHDDIPEVLKSSIAFQTQAKYDEWVASTSKVDLRLQDILRKKSLTFEQFFDTTDENCLIQKKDRIRFSIPIKRKDGKNYVIIEGKDFRIKNINALLDLTKEINSFRHKYSGGGYLQRTIKLLFKAIDGITAEEIGKLIRNGRKEYRLSVERERKEQKKKLKRSRAFIRNAVRLTKARKVDGGYFVKGLTGTTYFVDEEDLEVWIIKNEKKDTHLCIVDNDYRWGDMDEDALKNDRIAKRLLLLSKDEKVAGEIYDKGDKVDKWWLQIKRTNKGSVVA